MLTVLSKERIIQSKMLCFGFRSRMGLDALRDQDGMNVQIIDIACRKWLAGGKNAKPTSMIIQLTCANSFGRSGKLHLASWTTR